MLFRIRLLVLFYQFGTADYYGEKHQQFKLKNRNYLLPKLNVLFQLENGYCFGNSLKNNSVSMVGWIDPSVCAGLSYALFVHEFFRIRICEIRR